MKQVDLLIIGGGSAGMGAALRAKECGVNDILVIERSEELGGILQQCIHNGFGLKTFQEELSGPMYADRFIKQMYEHQISFKVNTTAVKLTKELALLYVNAQDGYVWVKAKAIILACGCFERNRGAISIPGKRLPGIYTAGSAQRFLNIENMLVGKNVFILGSGDIGLIMARRLTLEGAKVVGVAEIMPYSNGLTRNVVQCLQDFNIPLYLSHTIVDIQGDQHVEQVSIQRVDEQRALVDGTKQIFQVDTLLLSVGLIPENELGMQIDMELDAVTKGACVNAHYETSIPHVYACGNALHVHDIVDYVSMEAGEAGQCAAMDILHQQRGSRECSVHAQEGIAYVLPQYIDRTPLHDCTLCFRVRQPFQSCKIIVKDEQKIIKEIRKRYLLPAEMERIFIKKDEWKTIQGSLCVQVVSRND